MDITVHRGLPITTPARTVLDVAATLPPRDVELIVAEGFALRLLSSEALDAALMRAPNHPGAKTLQAVLVDGRLKRTDTGPEETLLRLIRAARLEEPETQHPLLDYDADFYWPEHNLVVEVDGGPWHDSPWARKKNARRDARIKQELGIDTIRIPDNAVEHDEHAAIATVAAALATRGGAAARRSTARPPG